MSRISITSIYKVIFILYIGFWMTTLKFSWNLTYVSTICNAAIFMLAGAVILRGLVNSKFDVGSWMLLFLASSIVLVSFANMFVNWSLLALTQVLSYILPWLILIMVVTNQETSVKAYKLFWRWFNNFFVIICLFGLCEYVLVYTLGYRPPIMELNTGMGDYYVGYFTLFQKIVGLDIPYFRFQGPLGESGDLAMWTSVLLVYNLLRKQYIYSTILLVAMFAAYSPSIIIALFVSFVCYVWSRSNLMALVLLLLAFFTALILYNDIAILYDTIMQMKATSLAERVDGVNAFFNALPFLLNSYPFGIPFFTETAEKVASGIGFSGVYGPIPSYEIGGVIAFLAHLVLLFYFLLLSIHKIFLTKVSLIENELYMYYLMMLPYVFQRQGFFEYALSAFLFAPIFFAKVDMSRVYDEFKKSRDVTV